MIAAEEFAVFCHALSLFYFTITGGMRAVLIRHTNHLLFFSSSDMGVSSLSRYTEDRDAEIMPARPIDIDTNFSELGIFRGGAASLC
jgi:hypothetical protein